MSGGLVELFLEDDAEEHAYALVEAEAGAAVGREDAGRVGSGVVGHARASTVAFIAHAQAR
jgi:hypothetical protein